MPSDMQAVLLVGGKGTRLQSLYGDRPKALVPVGGEPFLQLQIRWLARGGIHDIHLAAGHMADAIESWVAQNTPPGMRITVSTESKPLGTAGGLKFVAGHVRSDPFLVLNGDTIAPNLDFQSLEEAHADFSNAWKKRAGNFQPLENSPAVTIAVSPIESAGRYGTVEFKEDGRVTAFREKAGHRKGWINAGVYIMPRAALDAIQPDMSLSLETDIFPLLVAGRSLFAHPIAPPMLDMGTPEGLGAMEDYLAE